MPVYADAEEMLRTHKPRILCIATHPDSHYEYCRLAVNLKVPVIICEKPLADSLGDARKIAALGKKATILTNHERRYSADYIKARDILASNVLGSVLSIRAVIYMGRKKRLIDVIWHDGTHLADAIMFLTGTVLKNRGHFGANLNSTKGTAWLEGRAGNIPVLIEAGAGRDHLVFEIEVSCERGKLRIGNGIFEVWKSEESPYAKDFRSLKLIEQGFSGPTGFFANMFADAVACAMKPGRQPVSSAVTGLRVIEYLSSVGTWR